MQHFCKALTSTFVLVRVGHFHGFLIVPSWEFRHVCGECRHVELCSRKFILNFNQTNLESQVKSVRFLLNKPIK